MSRLKYYIVYLREDPDPDYADIVKARSADAAVNKFIDYLIDKEELTEEDREATDPGYCAVEKEVIT